MEQIGIKSYELDAFGGKGISKRNRSNNYAVNGIWENILCVISRTIAC